MSDKNPINLDALLEKRFEELGTRDTRDFTLGGETFQVKIPALCGSEWKDEQIAAFRDYDEGILTYSEFESLMLDLYLGEQAGKFAETVGKASTISAFDALLMVVGEIAEQVGKTQSRTSSRATRKPSKRR